MLKKLPAYLKAIVEKRWNNFLISQRQKYFQTREKKGDLCFYF